MATTVISPSGVRVITPEELQGMASSVPSEFSRFVKLLTDYDWKSFQSQYILSQLGMDIAIMRFFRDATPYATPKMKADIISKRNYIENSRNLKHYMRDVNHMLSDVTRLIATIEAIPKADSRNCKLESEAHKALALLLNLDSESWDREMPLYEFAQKVLPSLHNLRDTTTILYEEFDYIIYKDKRNFDLSLSQLKWTAGKSAINPSYDAFAAASETTPPAEVLSVYELCKTLAECYKETDSAISDMGGRTAILYLNSRNYPKLSATFQKNCRVQFESWNKDDRFACCTENGKGTIQEGLKNAIATINTTITSLKDASKEDSRRCIVSQEFAKETSAFLNVSTLQKEMSIHDFCKCCTESLETTRSFFEKMLRRIQILETAAHDIFPGNRCYRSALNAFQATLTGPQESSTLALFLAGTATAVSRVFEGLRLWEASEG